MASTAGVAHLKQTKFARKIKKKRKKKWVEWKEQAIEWKRKVFELIY